MISAVVPVYNSEKILFDSYESIKKELKKITKDYEIIFRNDGSTDNSEDILNEIAKDKKVRVFSNKNHGLGFVLRNLFKDAKGDIVIYFDADAYMSFDLSVLPDLLNTDADVVIASRYKNGKIPLHRSAPSFVYRIMNRILFGIDIRDIGSGFVIFKKKVLDSVELSSDGFEIHIELFTKIKEKGFKIIEVPVSYSHWKDGSFKISSHGPKTLANTIRYWVCR